jgi:hypothetical protein
LATLKRNLPPYCVPKKQKNHILVYFQVPKKLQPEGWIGPTESIGHTGRHTDEEIYRRGMGWYKSLLAARRKDDLGIEPKAPKGSLADVICTYKKSEYWINLKAETKNSYNRYLEVIKKWSQLSGYSHVADYKPKHIAKFLNRWQHSPRQRKYYKAVLSILFNIAMVEGLIDSNFIPSIDLPIINQKRKKIILWEEDIVDLFVAKADAIGKANVGTAILIGFESGQRWTDIVRLQEPQDYTGGCFFFYTSKTEAVIRIPATQRLRDRLVQRPQGQALLTVDDRTGQKWTQTAFSDAFDIVREACELEKYTFRQLRNSAAMFGDRADLTDAEFEAIFGWPKKNVRKMLSQYYADRDQEVCKRGIEKMEQYRQSKKASN